jgi:hypothetical protein
MHDGAGPAGGGHPQFRSGAGIPWRLCDHYGGKWATCRMCQDRLRLKPRNTQVSFEAVDRLWRLHGSRYLGVDVHQVRIRTFCHDDPESGE